MIYYIAAAVIVICLIALLNKGRKFLQEMDDIFEQELRKKEY